ncbi:MAG: hypothetical protein IPL04_10610 [Chitinophagaceae bacterium]|nr:hypothetical protein [Chitinophagaceae bacterium]
MKKILSLLFALYLLVPSGFGQDDEIMPKSLGISFFLNDFVTASRIRTTSLSSVLRNKSVAKFSEMTPGIAVNYYKGIKKGIWILPLLLVVHSYAILCPQSRLQTITFY